MRPFKPQNMSNNAAVTADGGEIGRAQALQARACGTAAVTDMNPVLLKPQSESGAQIVLQGRVWRAAGAGEYRRLAPSLLPAILGSFSRLAEAADLVLVEGAGSPAEINLRDGDIANMGFAEAADVPVVLVGDIERGGVIAQLVGTHALLSATERALLAGYIVNKFRGDVRLFDGGIAAITARTGMRCFGVVPFFAAAAALPAEDSLALSRPSPSTLRGPSLSRMRERVPSAARRVRAGGRSGSRSRCCRASPISTTWIRCARSRRSSWSWSDRGSRCRGTPRLSFFPARRRRSPISNSCDAKGGTSTSSRIAARADESSAFAADIRCSAGALPIRSVWRDGNRRCPGSASSTSRPF